MPTSAPDWVKYQECTRDYDAILEHARAVSAALVGEKAPTEQHGYGEQIFVKVLVHAITLRTLSPDPMRRTNNELWDLGSVSAIARCLIEGVDALLYICSSATQADERDFRLRLWLLHDSTRRSKMLNAIRSRESRAFEVHESARLLLEGIKTHPFFEHLKPGVKAKILNGDPPAFHLDQREKCAAAGIDFTFFNTATMQLSQFVHTFPFSVHQLFAFKAGAPDSLHLMKLPLAYCLPYLCVAIAELRRLFPASTPEPPSRVRAKMLIWQGHALQGLPE